MTTRELIEAVREPTSFMAAGPWITRDLKPCVRADDYDALRAATLAVLDEQTAALAELSALVRGECPALLDELRGGSSRLDLAIDAALANARALREKLR